MVNEICLLLMLQKYVFIFKIKNPVYKKYLLRI